MDQAMNTRSKLVVLALFGLACGPPKLIGGDSDADGESGDATTGDATTGDAPSNPSTSSSANSSTSDTDTGDEDTSDEDTLFFVPAYDIDGCECDPFAQDCPEGEKCVPYASTGGEWDANKCVPVTGDQATGEPCTYGGRLEATDDCDAMGICVDRDGDMLGTCHAFCPGTADNPQCPDNLLCEISNEGSATLCVEQCNPLLQDCEQPSACYWDNTGFHCLAGGDLAVGEPCGYANECPPGNQCVEAALLPSCDGEACCTGICELGLDENLCLLPGTACVPFFEQGDAPKGLEHVGLCLVP
jgi:hypothetical protein